MPNDSIESVANASEQVQKVAQALIDDRCCQVIVFGQKPNGDCVLRFVGSGVGIASLYHVGSAQLENVLRKALENQGLNG